MEHHTFAGSMSEVWGTYIRATPKDCVGPRKLRVLLMHASQYIQELPLERSSRLRRSRASGVVTARDLSV